MEPVRFNRAQRAELRRLGLVPEAINAIETQALPYARASFVNEPSNNDVRTELRALEKALTGAQEAIDRLMTATDAATHRREALRRILGAGRSVPEGRIYMVGLPALRRASDGLKPAIEVVRDVVAQIPRRPVRHQTADYRPVELIHVAIQGGMDEGGKPPRSRQLRPSASLASPFRAIVGICYAVMKAPTGDPVRAIRAYLKVWRPESEIAERYDRDTERPREI